VTPVLDWLGKVISCLFASHPFLRAQILTLLISAYNAQRGVVACDAFDSILDGEARNDLVGFQYLSDELIQYFLTGSIVSELLQRSCRIVARMCALSPTILNSVCIQLQKLVCLPFVRPQIIALCLAKHLQIANLLSPELLQVGFFIY
jgi:hypothetical protein